MEDVGIFYDHRSTLCPFGLLVYLSRFCMLYQEKSVNSDLTLESAQCSFESETLKACIYCRCCRQ
jgi:hypothetical protein